VMVQLDVVFFTSTRCIPKAWRHVISPCEVMPRHHLHCLFHRITQAHVTTLPRNREKSHSADSPI